MWTVEIKFNDSSDKEDRSVQFASRPMTSEGPHLFRIMGEQEGELWVPASEIDQIRVLPERTSETI